MKKGRLVMVSLLLANRIALAGCGIPLGGVAKSENFGQRAFNSDTYGGQSYERGVMAYAGWHAVQNQSQAIVAGELSRLRAAGRKDVEILDIGSGPGYTLHQFAQTAKRAAPGLHVHAHGLEYNDKMVRYSNATYGVEVRQGDMHALSSLYPAHSVDMIHAQSVLWASPTPDRIAHQIAQVQKRGGIATFTWPVRRTSRNGYDNYASWLRALTRDIDASVAAGRLTRAEADGVIEANRKFVLEEQIASPRDPEELIALFGAQGYTLEKQIPQYLDDRGIPFFYQYVFRKTR